jgi:glycosyltransferase 2 family protein
MKKHVLLLLKVGLSVGLVWYAFSRIDLSSAWQTLKSIPAASVALAAALLLFQLFLAALRIRELLVLLGQRYRVLAALDVVMIGAFFSQTFISFMGGDVMRVWRLARTGVPLGLAARSVLFDRVAGFAGLIALVLAVMPFLFPLVESAEMRAGLVLIALGALGGLGSLFLLRRMPAAFFRVRALRILLDVASDGLRISRSVRGTIRVFGLSVGMQTLNVLILFVLAAGLSMRLGLGDCFVFMPVVLFLSMLPISVAGWGVREGAMVAALGLIGVPAHESLALSICFGLCLIGVSVPGGVLWFYSRRRQEAGPLVASSTTTNAGPEEV